MMSIYRNAQLYAPGIELARQYMAADSTSADDVHPDYWLGTLYFEQGDFAQAKQ